MISSNLRQRLEQGLSLLQVMRVKSLGEPAVDLSERLSGLIPPTKKRTVLLRCESLEAPMSQMGEKCRGPFVCRWGEAVFGQQTDPEAILLEAAVIISGDPPGSGSK